MNARIRVLIADDHDVVSLGLASILKDEPDMDILLRIVHAGQALLSAIRVACPQVLLLDAQMPDVDPPCMLDMLTALFPRMRVVVVMADARLVGLVYRRGAAGCFLAGERLSHLLPMAVREVAAGNVWFSPKASQYLIQTAPSPIELDDSQWDVLRLMAQGQTPFHIASALQRSLRTIYNIQATIRSKLGVETNEQAILFAIRERYVPFRLTADYSSET